MKQLDEVEEHGLQRQYGLRNYGLYSYGLYSYGLCSYGLYSHGLYSHGLCSHGSNEVQERDLSASAPPGAF